MTLSRSRVALVALAFVLGACSGGTGTTGATGTPVTGGGASATVSTPAPTATPVATSAPTASASASPFAGPLPSGFNPCTLLTDAQASAVNGVTYGPGTVHGLNNGSLECVWGSTSPSASVVVQVAIWPTATLADATYTETLAALHGFSVIEVPNFADKAAIARAPGGTVSTGGIYVKDGILWFDVVYLKGTAPSDGQLTLAATLVLGALP